MPGAASVHLLYPSRYLLRREELDVSKGQVKHPWPVHNTLHCLLKSHYDKLSNVRQKSAPKPVLNSDLPPFSHMKAIIALLLLTLSMAGCKSGNTAQRATAVIYDGWWSSDYAAEGARMKCTPATVKWCEDDARADEAEFSGHLAAAFQSDPSCSGLRLLLSKNPKSSSSADNEKYVKLSAKPHWGLQVNFIPTLNRQPPSDKQPWQLSLDPGMKHYSSGENDAQGLAHIVCSIAKNTGGTIAD